MKLILASRSPRRRALLAEAGYEFEVALPSAAAECGICSHEGPAGLVQRLAINKAGDVAARVARGLVLGCDTMVECGGEVLGKPAGEDDARRMLTLLRGQRHRVYSGVCLWRRPDDEVRTGVEVTVLTMDAITNRQIEEYVRSGQWEGKAGAFGYQDRHGWIRIVEGDESNVVGLPLGLVKKLIEQLTPAAGH